MRRSIRHLSKLRTACVVLLLAACNGLLDNDPRELYDDFGGDGTIGHAGDSAGVGIGGALSSAGKSSTGGTDVLAGAGGSVSSDGGDPGEAAAGSAGEGGVGGEPNVELCDLPTRQCDAGDVDSEEVSCGTCNTGTATRTRTCRADCTWGRWSALSACQSTEECTPGETGTNTQQCGACNTGTQTQTRTCSDTCTWGAWSAWSACANVTAQCTPGQTQPQSVTCACGGSKSQSRTCSASCTWGGWTDTTSCDLECCSEVVYCNTPDNIGVPASRGTWCRQTHNACSRDEVRADCLKDVSDISCTLHQELYIEYR